MENLDLFRGKTEAVTVGLAAVAQFEQGMVFGKE